MARTRIVVLILVAALGRPVLVSCRFRERVCHVGEYAARSIAYPRTGRLCVPTGQPPPAGYENFPAGSTPTYVDQDHG